MPNGIEVEFIDGAPAKEERKAIEDFFDWLFVWAQDEKDFEGVEDWVCSGVVA